MLTKHDFHKILPPTAATSSVSSTIERNVTKSGRNSDRELGQTWNVSATSQCSRDLTILVVFRWCSSIDQCSTLLSTIRAPNFSFLAFTTSFYYTVFRYVIFTTIAEGLKRLDGRWNKIIHRFIRFEVSSAAGIYKLICGSYKPQSPKTKGDLFSARSLNSALRLITGGGDGGLKRRVRISR